MPVQGCVLHERHGVSNLSLQCLKQDRGSRKQALSPLIGACRNSETSSDVSFVVSGDQGESGKVLMRGGSRRFNKGQVSLIPRASASRWKAA